MHLLSTVGSILIIIVMIPYLVNWVDQGITASQQRIVANHLQMVSQAARQYINRHQDDLLTQATANTGPQISINDLITDELLQDGFQAQNAWAQEYAIYIRQPTDGYLQAIVLTTGGRVNDTDKWQNVVVPGAAALVGGSGGYVGSGLLHTVDTLVGSGQGWLLNLPTLGIASPGAGHLGAVTSFDSTALGQDYLYRVAVPGQPELNAMQTGLDMTDHDISNVSNLIFTEREITSEACDSEDVQGRVFLDPNFGLYLCRNHSMEIIGDSGNSTLLKNITIAKNGDTITKPTCATSTNTTPAIFTSPALMEAGEDAPPMTAIQTWATSTSDTQWTVHMRVQTPSTSITGADSDGWVYPIENHGRIIVMTTCVK